MLVCWSAGLLVCHDDQFLAFSEQANQEVVPKSVVDKKIQVSVKALNACEHPSLVGSLQVFKQELHRAQSGELKISKRVAELLSTAHSQTASRWHNDTSVIIYLLAHSTKLQSFSRPRGHECNEIKSPSQLPIKHLPHQLLTQLPKSDLILRQTQIFRWLMQSYIPIF